jgi:3-hydroxyisobutyrate dehydrogenase
MTFPYGLIGLGNMGVPIAENLTKNDIGLIVYDIDDPSNRAPEKAHVAATPADVWRQAETVFLCLPKGDNCKSALQSLLECNDRVTSTVIELSTIGMPMAQEIDAMLKPINVNYFDSPMSGGVAGAKAATLTLMCAGSKDLLEEHRAALKAISGNIFHLGNEPGKGQAMKLINNFMAATGLAVTSEAMAYGVDQGMDLKTMLDVVNVSTGANVASQDKFPKRVLTETYDANFHTALLSKDVGLFHEGLKAAGLKGQLAPLIDALWKDADQAMPGSDMTEIYKLMQKKLKS